MFNYLVTLFQRRPVRQGLFGRPVFARPLDRHFGWLGLLTGLGGVITGGTSLLLGAAAGWEVSRLWLWLLASALLILVGLQLIISWVVMRVLEALSERALDPGEQIPGTLSS
jgi:hypothetical protein